MSLPLVDLQRADTQRFIMLSCKAFVEGSGLEDKFQLVASRLRAEPLGFCLLKSGKEYPIIKIERRYDYVTVHVPFDHGKLYAHPLPITYAEMVTENL